MKKHISFIVILLLAVSTAFSQKDKFTVKVDGLGCPFCAFGLEKKFKEVDGISKIAIDIENGIMTYEVPAEKAMSIAQVDERVTAAGYTMRKVTINRSSGATEQSEEAVVAAGTEGMTEKSFMVNGSCDMCKARIEKAAMGVKGVKKAEWNSERQMLTVAYEGGSVDLAEVQTVVAKSGHDTAGPKASSKTYNNLPGCCKYR